MLRCGTATSHNGPGVREVQEHWLNEGQALTVCVLSRIEKAKEVRATLQAPENRSSADDRFCRREEVMKISDIISNLSPLALADLANGRARNR
jgi:hypothetical protein